MQYKLRLRALTLAALSAALPLAALADGGFKPHEHVLLISIDGMHAADLQYCVAHDTCPTLSRLNVHGVNYLRTTTSRPSDSFPGLMALVSGGTPRTVGAFYDVAYDRVLAPPTITTGNGLGGGSCALGVPNGTTTEFDEGIDINQGLLNGGAPGASLTDGGVASIDAARLIRNPDNGCKPVYPWNFVRTNTIFGVIHAAGGYTAWSDKHPAYSSVAGTGGSVNINDYFSPEINSNVVPLPGIVTATGVNCATVQDPTSDLTAWTNSFANIQCYDAIKVDAIVNEINGRDHLNRRNEPTPNIFGMNFQAVSVGQKLIEKRPNGSKLTGGYKDPDATPTPLLQSEITFVDQSIGRMVSALEQRGLMASTWIIVTAKHGQSPIDPQRYVAQLKVGSSPATVLAQNNCIPYSGSPLNPTGIGPTEDDVSLIWLTPNCSQSEAVSILQASAGEIAIDEIFVGQTLTTMFNVPGIPPSGDPRTPDLIVAPNIGHTYSGSSAKHAEHGGFAYDDTNVMMLVSNPGLGHKTVHAFVETTQVAPTVLQLLGLNPQSLDAVRTEGTPVLPELF